MVRQKKGFTLLELLVAVAIIVILTTVSLYVINPGELLRQSRDSTRLSNLLAMNSAVSLFSQNVKGGFLGTSTFIYISIPDPTATSSAGDQCQGLGLLSLPPPWTYHCAATSTVRKIDGTGWIPVALNSITGGSPLSNLYTDPQNVTSTRLYYAYTTTGSNYEFTSPMESQKYGLGGSGDVVSTDGGIDATLYELGSSVSLQPLDYGDPTLIGYWRFYGPQEGSGTAAYDYSGNNNTAYVSGSWSTNSPNGTALQANNNTTGASTSPGSFYPITGFTVLAWVNSTDTDSFQSPVVGFSKYDGLGYGFWWLVYGNGNPSAGAQDSNGNFGTIPFPTTTANIANGQWNEVGATFSVNGGINYVNGAITNSSTFSAPFTGDLGTPQQVYFGYKPIGTVSSSQSLNGLIDNVRIYSRILSPAQIQAIYQQRD